MSLALRFLLLAAAAPLIACDTVDRFDTGPDAAYCGQIVGATFVRQAFDRQLQLQLRLNMAELSTLPGELSTADSDIGPCAPEALFTKAKLRAPQKLENDALSAFSFSDGSLTNFLSWVDSTCAGTFLAVVSLMRDGEVEVRLMKGALDADGKESGPFGVFKLRRSESQCSFLRKE